MSDTSPDKSAAPALSSSPSAQPDDPHEAADAAEAAKPFVHRLFKFKWGFWVIVAVVLALDLGTKVWAEKTLTITETWPDGHARQIYDPALPHDGVVLIPGVQNLKWAENFGAAFSIGSNNTLALAFVSIGVLGIIFYYVLRTPARRRFLLLCLALVTGGALGNLWDRLTHDTVDDRPMLESWGGAEQNPNYGKPATAVRDFLYWPFDIPIYATWGVPEEAAARGHTRKWPIFNIADMGIVGGVIGLCGFFLLVPDKKRRKPEQKGEVQPSTSVLTSTPSVESGEKRVESNQGNSGSSPLDPPPSTLDNKPNAGASPGPTA